MGSGHSWAFWTWYFGRPVAARTTFWLLRGRSWLAKTCPHLPLILPIEGRSNRKQLPQVQRITSLRAWVSQILALLQLAPDIQEAVLFLPP